MDGIRKTVDTFEKYMEKYGLPFAMVDSGSNALFMAVTLLDLPSGSEVICLIGPVCTGGYSGRSQARLLRC